MIGLHENFRHAAMRVQRRQAGAPAVPRQYLDAADVGPGWRQIDQWPIRASHRRWGAAPRSRTDDTCHTANGPSVPLWWRRVLLLLPDTSEENALHLAN